MLTASNRSRRVSHGKEPLPPPRLSIGLPVYNGQRFLAYTLENLLNQTFADFELVVADNASTDGTKDIVDAFSAHDKRIRYVRHNENRGAVFNWNYVVHQARGEYFKWASSNDYYAPDFLEKCIAVLDERDDVVLCYTRTNLVDEDQGTIGVYEGDFSATDESAGKRFIRLMSNGGKNNAQAGVIRTKSLRSTRLEPAYPHGDKVLMAELALHGKYWLIDEPLFYRRDGKGTSSIDNLNTEELQTFLAPQSASHRLPYWRRQLGFVMASVRSSEPLPARMGLMLRVFQRAVIWQRTELFREFGAALSRQRG